MADETKVQTLDGEIYMDLTTTPEQAALLAETGKIHVKCRIRVTLIDGRATTRAVYRGWIEGMREPEDWPGQGDIEQAVLRDGAPPMLDGEWPAHGN